MADPSGPGERAALCLTQPHREQVDLAIFYFVEEPAPGVEIAGAGLGRVGKRADGRGIEATMGDGASEGAVAVQRPSLFAPINLSPCEVVSGLAGREFRELL